MSVHGIRVFKNLFEIIISCGHAMVFYSAINNAKPTSCYGLTSVTNKYVYKGRTDLNLWVQEF